MDSAHVRNANDSHGGDASVVTWKYRTCGRWDECASRSLEYSRCHRYGRRVRHLPGLSENAESHGHGSGYVPQANNAHSVQAFRMGFVQLLVEHSEIHGVVSEVDVRRCRQEGKRFRFSLLAENRPSIFLG